jgi:hypothetical protein
MENDVAPATSPAREFLPLLEVKLKKLFEQRERISEEIEETSRMIDEFKVKLAGGELPLPIGESIVHETAVEFVRHTSTSY